MKHFAYIILALCAPFAALAQRTEAGGASGFARGAHASRTLSPEWAASNHVRQASAYDDYDGDLLENWAEEALGTSPWTNDLTSANASAAAALGALDLVPAKWKAAHGFDLADVVGDADTDNDGWDNWSEWMSGSDPRDASSRPNPTLRATVDLGRLAAHGRLVIHAYSRFDMNGWPDAVYAVDLPANASASVTVVDLRDADLVYGHLRQGPNWFFAWTNEDGSTLSSVNGGDWPPYTNWEPASVADDQFHGIPIGFDRNEVTFHLTEKAESFARFSWQGKVPDDMNGYRVIVEATEVFYASNAEDSKKKSILWPRTWIHEWDVVDFNAVDSTGDGVLDPFNLGLGVRYGYDADNDTPQELSVEVSTESGSRFNLGFDAYVKVGAITNWMHTSSALSLPVCYAPANMVSVSDMRPEFQFSLDPEYTEFRFTLANYSGEIYSERFMAPGRRLNPATGRRDLVVWRLPTSLNNIPGFATGRSTGWTVTGYSPVLNSYNANRRSAMVNFCPMDYPASSVAAVTDATGGSGATGRRVSAWRDAACVNQLLWCGTSGLDAGMVRVPLPAGGPYFIKAEAVSGGAVSNSLGIGYAVSRRPVPIFGEYGVNSVTNTVILRRFK